MYTPVSKAEEASRRPQHAQLPLTNPVQCNAAACGAPVEWLACAVAVAVLAAEQQRSSWQRSRQRPSPNLTLAEQISAL